MASDLCQHPIYQFTGALTRPARLWQETNIRLVSQGRQTLPSWLMVHFGLIAFAAVVLLAGITAPLYRNEGLRADLPPSHWKQADWLTPRLYGEPHLTKPPGMGVMISICSLPFGTVTPILAQLPSVVAGAALMAMVGVVFAQRFDREAGFGRCRVGTLLGVLARSRPVRRN
jgi:4-amino-4-deoxy-L-arabinose transferase-like glycosyltransferase